MKNKIEEYDTYRPPFMFGMRIKLQHRETCKNLLERLFAIKEKFFALREYMFELYTLLLNTSILSDKTKLLSHIEQCQQELKNLAEDIACCEFKLNEQLGSANLMLAVTVTEEKKLALTPNENKVIDDLTQLKQDIGYLRINHTTSFSYPNITYPSYTQNMGFHWKQKNQQNLDTIQDALYEEKVRDNEKNKQIKANYEKVADSTRQVMKHNLYSYRQSWRTCVLNVVGIITGIGIITGLYKKACGNPFLLWEKKRRADLYMQNGDMLRGTADILGIPKNK